MFTHLGYAVQRCTSQLATGGTGVAVCRGTVPPGAIVSMYPGTIYLPYEPIFFASLANPFIFRCLDGTLIDGNDKHLSWIIYRSCCQRDRIGLYPLGDLSWLTKFPVNPLAVGQYVNNQSTRFAANVAYQEFGHPRRLFLCH
ncbi:SET domain-containing protein 9-like [Liolophura sinensis]|uniref:SET domain-containing protein 9-like n=1 Tax=Liolophura sinensis TaxID=3198878 RepID=UPI00315994F8